MGIHGDGEKLVVNMVFPHGGNTGNMVGNIGNMVFPFSSFGGEYWEYGFNCDKNRKFHLRKILVFLRSKDLDDRNTSPALETFYGK